MRGRKLSAMILAIALAACADAGEETDDAAANGGVPADAPATAPADGGMGQVNAGTPPPGSTAEDVSAGQQLFTSTGNCYTCHGPDAKGTQLAPNLTDSEWINITEPTMDNIQTVITAGVKQPKQHPAPMPEMGGAQLNDNQIKQLAAYVWSLGGGR
jgi:mono/diheme cytochrome c family protein